MRENTIFSIFLIATGVLLKLFTDSDWDNWLLAIGIIIGLCA